MGRDIDVAKPGSGGEREDGHVVVCCEEGEGRSGDLDVYIVVPGHDWHRLTDWERWGGRVEVEIV